MKHNREYEIAWQGLKLGPNTYVYDIDDRFMVGREAEEGFKDWNGRITLTFDKHESFFMLHFDIDGNVTVPCDRCGDEFRMRLWDEFNLIVKLTDDENKAEDEDDVVFLPRHETVIDISNWLYEFLMLSVPIQRIHPENTDGTSGCNQQALQLLDQLSELPEPEAQENPLWKGLAALKVEDEEQPKAKPQPKPKPKKS